MSEDGASIATTAARLRAREVTAVELTRAALDRIAATDEALHAFLTVTADQALAAAAEADERLAAGNTAGPLTGIPVAVKDIIATAGVRTTAASQDPRAFRAALRRHRHRPPASARAR